MVRLARKERLNYDDFLYVCQQVRKKLGLRRPKRQQMLPQLLPATVLAFSPRRVQQIVHQYRQRAGIAQPVHPHLFRHQMLTYLTSQGLSDAQIQLISGHKTKKSLEVYQHLSLQAVESAYQEAVHSLNI